LNFTVQKDEFQGTLFARAAAFGLIGRKIELPTPVRPIGTVM